MKGCMILANGFEDLEATGTIALLRRGGLEVDLFTIEQENPTGKYGLTLDHIKPLTSIVPNEYQLVILPGGPGYEALKNNTLVTEVINEFYSDKKYIAAICAAPTIFGELGLLRNKTYTCFPGMESSAFEGYHVDDKAVIDGTIITGKSAGAVTDFALAILTALLGKEAAESVKQKIYF